MKDLISDWDLEHDIIIVNTGLASLLYSLCQPDAAIIIGNLGGGYLHSERRASCFNCTLVTYFLRAYRSERLDELVFNENLTCISYSWY